MITQHYLKTNERTLYRAVKSEELDDIQQTGKFNLVLQSAEGKYFTSSAIDASSYAKKAYYGFGDPCYTMISTKISEELLSSPVRVDGHIPAYVLPESILKILTPTIHNTMDFQ